MNKFSKYLNSNYNLGDVNKIRPKVILKSVENLYKNPVEMKLCVPSSEIGSLTTLEASMLISILKIFKPKVVFEYGTFLGYSTSIFLKNTSKNCKVFSIDLGNELSQYEISDVNVKEILQNDKVNDDYLRMVQSKSGPIYIKKEIDKNKNRLQLLHGDSTKLSVNDLSLNNIVNFVFIDGGHTYDIIKSDTEKSFQMVKNGIIIWHDYNSKIHGDVTTYLNELSKDKKIFHIENTMLAFHIIE
jgi:hypothetical protein